MLLLKHGCRNGCAESMRRRNQAAARARNETKRHYMMCLVMKSNKREIKKVLLECSGPKGRRFKSCHLDHEICVM